MTHDDKIKGIVSTILGVQPEHTTRKYLDLWGAPLVLNTWLAAGCVALSVLVICLAGAVAYLGFAFGHLKPIVVRIDAVGRAEAVTYDAAAWKPQVPELRYFLTRFVKLHRERLRATVARDFPDSLLFLDSTLATPLLSTSTGIVVPSDEIMVDVQNVTFSNLSTPPYQAAVDFTERTFALNMPSPKLTNQFTAQVAFTFRDAVPSHYIPVNPLGLQITQLRVDQAFVSTRSN